MNIFKLGKGCWSLVRCWSLNRPRFRICEAIAQVGVISPEKWHPATTSESESSPNHPRRRRHVRLANNHRLL